MFRPRMNRIWPWLAAALVACGGCSPSAMPPVEKPSPQPATDLAPSSDAPATAAPKPAAVASPSRLFDGKTLAGWKTADEVEFTRHGKVEVRDGAIQLAAGDPATGVVRTVNPPTDNYELTLSAKRTGGQDFFCGLTFPVGKESCSLIVGGWGGQVVGLSNVDGAAADENQTTVHKVFEENRWYRIRLKVTPAAIFVSIDGEELINLPRGEHQFSIWPQQEPMRPLGIATWYTGAALKDIELKHDH